MENSILGFWSLVSWHKILQDGNQIPYSEYVVGGFLFYSADGGMAVSIYERDQPRLLSSYGGTYEYLNHEVIHYPLEGSSPNGIQDKKIRQIKITGKIMTMETLWQNQGLDDFIYRLIWQKIS